MASPDLLHFGGSLEKRNAFRSEVLAVQTPAQGGIKTNGSLIRSHSGPSVVSEPKSIGTPRRAVNFTPKSITNPENLTSRADSNSPRPPGQNLQEEEDYDSDEDNHFLALYSNSVPSRFDLLIKATEDASVMEENEVDEQPSQMLLSECPEFIPYLNPPSPSLRSGCDNLLGVNGESIGEQVNTDDEIVYGFRSVDPNVFDNGGEKPNKTAEECDFRWELIESRKETDMETENRFSNSLRKYSISELAKSQSAPQRKPLLSPKMKQITHKAPGVDGLIDCAADELDRLRVGAAEAVLRRPVAPSAPADVHPVARRREEKTQSTTGTLVSLLQIQLTELYRMAEKVNKEFNNQLAHERALLELLELEHERVKIEVKQAESKGPAPPDLVNHLRHLKDRLEQQTSLIDDLEYQYLEEKTKYEEERESLLVQLRLNQDSPLSRSNCETQCTPDPVAPKSIATAGARAENNSSKLFSNSPNDNPVHPLHSEGLSRNSKCPAGEVPKSSPSSICNGLTPPKAFPHSQNSASGSPTEPLYSTLQAIGVDASLVTMTPNFSPKEFRKADMQQAKNGQRELQQQYNGEKSPGMTQTASLMENCVQVTRSQTSTQNPQSTKATVMLPQCSSQEVTMSDLGVFSQNQQLKLQSSGRSPLNGVDFIYQSTSGFDTSLQHPKSDPGMGENSEVYQPLPSGCYHYQQQQKQQQHQQQPIQFPAMNEESRAQHCYSSQSTVVTLSSQGPERGSGGGGDDDDDDDCGGLGSAYSDRQIFHAVPPLPPGSGALITTTPSFVSTATHPSAPIINCNNPDKTVTMRMRTVSAGRRVGMDAEARPLTRYLPVPDDVSFDLRNHLESICGHTLCSPTLSEQVCVETTCCSGFLYKIDSTLSQVFSSPQEVDAFASPATSRRRPPIGGSGVKGGPPHSGSSSVMGSAFSFLRRRPRRRRWFVLDRRRRLLTYYAIQGAKAPATPLKPKDAISFTDIIDVYPDHKARSGHDSHSSSFCLLLMANNALLAEPNVEETNSPAYPARSRIQTRVLSLAAPSPEAMRVWVDALFTCAGAYLCLPSRSQWPAG